MFLTQKTQQNFCRSNYIVTLPYIAVTQAALSNPEKFTQNWICKQTGKEKSRKKNKLNLPNRVVQFCFFKANNISWYICFEI